MHTAKRELIFYEATKEYRAQVLEELTSTSFSGAAVFQGQNTTDAIGSRSNLRQRQLLYSLCAKYPDTKKCYWIKRSGRRGPWTDNENIKTELQQKIRELYNLYKGIEKLHPDTDILDRITFNKNKTAAAGAAFAAATNNGDPAGGKKIYIYIDNATIRQVDDAPIDYTPIKHYGNAAFSRLGGAGFTAKQQKEIVLYDSGCTDYAIPKLDWMINLVPASLDDWLGTVGEGHALKITHWGRIELNVIVDGEIQTLRLDGAVYVPDTATTLISTGKLKSKGIF